MASPVIHASPSWARALQHLPRHGWCGGKGAGIRNPRAAAALPIGRPCGQQIEVAVEQRLALAAGVRQEDPELAVLNAARRATVLPCDARGVCALFEKAGFVDHAHPVGGVQVGRDIGVQPLAQGVRSPLGPAQPVRKTLGRLVPTDFRQLPTLFPFRRA
jgi:hypothetical protein